MRVKLSVFLLGVREWRSVVEGGVGMTYPDHELSEAYDTGVNVGQNLNLIGQVLRNPLKQHVLD